jgi:alpha-ketoglutarate-dependent taurine dioxygenase
MSSSTTQTSLDIDVQPGRPAVLQVAPSGSAASWAAENRDALRASVAEHGAVLVRGLGLKDAAEVADVFRALGGTLMVEMEAIATRKEYSAGVYGATPWPPNQPMCMHHEMSYLREPAGLMMFACVTAPTSGGATAVSDASKILEALPADLVNRVAQDGWMLTRNYNEEIGSSYAEAFRTESREEIEAYCKANDIEFEWQSDGGLRTRQRRQAVVQHPKTGKRCWFNQIAFLNAWTLDPEVREYLVEVYGSEGLPFNTSFGTGDAIGEDVVQVINETYEANTLREPWQAGDLLLVDNIAMAHSREAFKGDRELLVAMADPVRLGG